MKNKIILLMILVIIALVLLLVFPVKQKELIVEKIQVENCSIMEEKCVVNLQDSSVGLDITPRGMPSKEIAQAVVSFENISVDKIEISFKSPAISHAMPTLPFEKINDRKFTGKVFLPLCTFGQKVSWVANLKVYTSDKIWHIIFPFEHVVDSY